MASGRDDEVICFLCDFGLYILVLLLIAIALFWAQVAPVIGLPGASIPSNPPVSSNPVAPVRHPPNLPEMSETPNHLPVTTPTLEYTKASATAVITVLATEQSDSATPEVTTKTPIISPTPNSPPEYVIAFIPLHWSGTREDFLNTAQRTGDFFVQASGIDRFFSVHYLFFEEGYSEGSLSDEDLLTNMMTYAIQQKAADRYIGITDGDLAPGDRTWVAGYTFGMDEQGVVAETGEDTIVAHELGHTYGLCDEYNFQAWEEQNTELANGCPNPYPEHCPKNSGVINECDGTPSEDGLMSLMAASGPSSLGEFNESCYRHLQTVFGALSGASGTK